VRVQDEPPYVPSTRAREAGPYPDFETARSRFRLNPVQPVADLRMLEHLARHSVRTRDGLWQWKFDPDLQGSFIQDPRSLLRRIGIPLDVIYGEQSSVMTRERAAACVAALPHGRGPVAIPAARHHMMFDHPVALVATLRALLAQRR
jgi:pimeloyl-ACP methyl ester carboxylesterase